MNTKPWRILEETESLEVWQRFARVFEFKPSMAVSLDNPTFKEPLPSVTFDVSDDSEDDSEDKNIEEEDFFKIMLGHLARCTEKDEEVYILDWHHTCYAIYPHHITARDHPPMMFYPDGDYIITLSKDFSWGTLGHPWEQSICIFGSKLIDAVLSKRPKLFNKVIRQNGLPAREVNYNSTRKDRFELLQATKDRLIGGGDIACYIQDTPRDRLAWIYATPKKLKTYSKNLIYYRALKLEVTYESFEKYDQPHDIQKFDEQESDFLEITHFEVYDIADFDELSYFFSRHIKNPEFIKAPFYVEYPYQFIPLSNLEDRIQNIFIFKALLELEEKELRVSFVYSESLIGGRLFCCDNHSFKIFNFSFPSMVFELRCIDPAHFYVEGGEYSTLEGYIKNQTIS
jgi:hypothetical protein